LNVKFWDSHKVSSVIVAVILVILIAITDIMGVYEDKAIETASQQITSEEAEAILKYFEIYDSKLPPIYHTLDSLTTWLWWIALIASLYAAWTALSIPERYQKEKEVTRTDSSRLE